MTPSPAIRIVPATERDTATIHSLIRALASYERIEHEMEATEDDVREALFGERPNAEAVLAYVGPDLAGYALFFHNFSTLLGRRGLYLEDRFVLPAFRARGVGRRLLAHLARIAVQAAKPNAHGPGKRCCIERATRATRYMKSVLRCSTGT